MTVADTLSTHIEMLSTDFLLADPTSQTDIDHLEMLFRVLDEEPWKRLFPDIAEIARQAMDLLRKHLKSPDENGLRIFDALGDLICDIQNRLRKRSLMEPADPGPGMEGLSHPPSPPLAATGDSAPDSASSPSPHTRRLRHPGTLPDHLDMGVFEEFLAAQPEVIQKMETLILNLEHSFSEKDMAELKRLIHTAKGEAGFLNLADVERVLHQVEAFLEQGFEKKSSDLLLSMVDWLKKSCEIYSGWEGVPPPVEPLLLRLGQKREAASLPLESEPSSAGPSADDTKIIAEKPSLPPNGEGSMVGAIRDTIAVDADRLDRMVNMIGELVIVESMLSQSEELRQLNSPRIFKTIGAIAKITRELQAMGLSLRMIPIRSVFQKMGRIARDVAKKAGKPIRFVMTGEETELDKTMVDKLSDPLMHLVRNAIDHGIEEGANERARHGKPAVAVVVLRAFHQGGNVHVEVQDDGIGLDPEKILSRAIEMNLVSPGDSLSEQEIFKLIFEPGFSTAKEITEISGRGVGMNVVRQRIESLRGTIHIQTKAFQGATFSLVIPLTLAIIDGLIVRSGGIRFVIPALSIRTTLCVERSAIRSILGQEEVILFMEKTVQIFRLSTLTGDPRLRPNDPTSKTFAVIVETGEQERAVLVDELIGKQQIVIKSLGELISQSPFVSGGAILNDGQVGLILDVAGLVKNTTKKPS